MEGGSKLKVFGSTLLLRGHGQKPRVSWNKINCVLDFRTSLSTRETLLQDSSSSSVTVTNRGQLKVSSGVTSKTTSVMASVEEDIG